ncbi:MAG: FtsQ-type POTRA domain-containing protein [Corynebacterium sp.]|uniref:cell division protein FtsQ/DivIB n=1 Tax=Corynebacterium sp. TaxID=1720 RepID=UPI0026E0FF71|nr:FtsQ-type POTRA domain-containing protein [Corynebacterium sp.]MDO5668827.1 FtsQ-type POTRA domain-containing protein [Corynebacterium sp.]
MSRKKILLSAAGVLAVILLALGVLWAFPILRVNSYEVSGNVHSPEEYVVEATGVELGDNLVRVDAGSAAQGVAELPWVRSATVTRQWPGTLGVEVTERQALMYSRESDGEHLIDTEGRPFVIDTPPEGAIEVTGALREDPEALDLVADALMALPEHVRALIAEVEVPGKNEITLRLQDGRTIFWGASESNHDKALAMQTVIQREGGHWNVSNPALVTVR